MSAVCEKRVLFQAFDTGQYLKLNDQWIVLAIEIKQNQFQKNITDTFKGI